MDRALRFLVDDLADGVHPEQGLDGLFGEMRSERISEIIGELKVRRAILDDMIESALKYYGSNIIWEQLTDKEDK